MDKQLWIEFQAKLKKHGANSVYSAREMLVQEFLQLETTRRLSNDGSERAGVDKRVTQDFTQGLPTPTSSINMSSHSISRSHSSDQVEDLERRCSMGSSTHLVDGLPQRIENSNQGEANQHKDLFESFVHDIVGRVRSRPQPRAQRRFSLPSFGMPSERKITGASTMRRSSSKDGLPTLLLQLGLQSVERSVLADGNHRSASRPRTSSMDATTLFPRQSRRHSVGGGAVSSIPYKSTVKQSTQSFRGISLDKDPSVGLNTEFRVNENEKEEVGTARTFPRAARRMSAPHSYLAECSDTVDSALGVREIDAGDDIKSFSASDSNLLVSFPTKPRRRTSLLGCYTLDGTPKTREMNTSIAKWDVQEQKSEWFDQQLPADAVTTGRGSSCNLPPAGSSTEIESVPFVSVDSDKLKDSPHHPSQDGIFVSAAY